MPRILQEGRSLAKLIQNTNVAQMISESLLAAFGENKLQAWAVCCIVFVTPVEWVAS